MSPTAMMRQRAEVQVPVPRGGGGSDAAMDMCGQLLNGTFMHRVAADLRWTILIATSAVYMLGFVLLGAPRYPDGSSLFGLRMQSYELLPSWLGWRFMFSWHMLWWAAGVYGLVKTRTTDPGKYDPAVHDTNDPGLLAERVVGPEGLYYTDRVLHCFKITPVGTINPHQYAPVRTDEAGEVEWGCVECGAPQNQGFRHCYSCECCVRGRWHHCGLIGVCVGINNTYYFMLLLTSTMAVWLGSFVTLCLTQVPVVLGQMALDTVNHLGEWKQPS